MKMREDISKKLKESMKNKDMTRLSTLRLISAAIKDKDIALRGETGEGEVSDADILGILGKMVKQRQESARVYEEGGRLELAEKERDEVIIIEEFLPKQLNESEVASAIETAIASTGADSIRDMGKVMGALKSKYTGQMDFGRAGGLVKAKLG
ncbi:MAG: GatB/YqeY domain-containing protein [Pseudoruegeria sp.]